MTQTTDGDQTDPSRPAGDQLASFSPTPPIPPILGIIFFSAALLVFWDGGRRKNHSPAFIDLPPVGGVVHLLVACVSAAVVAAMLTLAVRQVAGRVAETTAAFLALVLLVGYLARLHAVPTSQSFRILALGSVFMFALMALGRRLGEAGDQAVPAPGVVVWLVGSTVALLVLVTVLSTTQEKIVATVGGIRPSAVLGYLLFTLVAALILVRPRTALTEKRPSAVGTKAEKREKGRKEKRKADVPKQSEIFYVSWAVAAPLGLLFVTSDLGASLVLATGLLAAMAARPFPPAATTSDDGATAGMSLRTTRLVLMLTAGAVYGGACALWWLVSPTVEEFRAAIGVAAFDPDRAWLAARTVGARLSGLGPSADALSDNRLDYELATVTFAEQYGVVYTALAFLALSVLVGLLAHAALRARGTGVGAVALGVVAMLAAAVVLPGISLLINVPLGVGVPLFAADATSFVLALGAVGFVIGVGVGADVGAGVPADGAAAGQDEQNSRPYQTEPNPAENRLRPLPRTGPGRRGATTASSGISALGARRRRCHAAVPRRLRRRAHTNARSQHLQHRGSGRHHPARLRYEEEQRHGGHQVAGRRPTRPPHPHHTG
jgi:hypothetical protein